MGARAAAAAEEPGTPTSRPRAVSPTFPLLPLNMVVLTPLPRPNTPKALVDAAGGPPNSARFCGGR